MKSRSFFVQNIGQNVIFTMAFCVVGALAVLAFRYKQYVPCSPIPIIVKSSSFYASKSIHFKAGVPDKNTEVSWKIGDSIIAENELEIWHTFNAPGRYVVTLITNQDCSTENEIIIGEAPPKPILRPQFTGPSQVTVGEIARFKDTTAYATS